MWNREKGSVAGEKTFTSGETIQGLPSTTREGRSFVALSWREVGGRQEP